MPRTLTAVIYDLHTLAPRRVIGPHDDSHLTNGMHKPGPGEGMVVIPNTLIAGMNVTAAAVFAVMRKTGRMPPAMDVVHAHDALARNMNGGALKIY